MSTPKARAGKRRRIERPRAPGAPFTVDEAAVELRLAPRTVRKRIAEGKLRAYRDGRAVRITEEAMVEYRHSLMGPAAHFPAGTGLSVRRHLGRKARPRA